MNYGSFTRDGSAYVITRFDTPRPWLNAIYNEQYGVYLSQNAFGFSYYKDPESVRVTHVHVPGYVPTDPQTGKFVYLRDGETGKVWPNVPMHAAKGYSRYRCTHGQGWTEIRARRNGIETTFLLFVPLDDPAELWQVTLRNTTKRPRRIKAFACQQWLMTAPSGPTDHLTYTRAGYDAALCSIVARTTNTTSPFMYDAFMTMGDEPDDWDCRYDRFIGTYGRLEQPEAVLAGAGTCSAASGERMVGALSRTVALAPGGEHTFRVLTGACEAVEGVSQAGRVVPAMQAKYLPPTRADAELERVRWHWQRKRETLTCKTPDKTVNVVANSWVKWQNTFTTRHARGAYRGFRDILQDSMGITPLEPAFTRHWLIESFQHQYANGLCLRGWNPVKGTLDRRLHRDSPIWAPLTLSAYLRETGEFELLDVPVPFLDEGAAPVFDHAFAGMRRLHDERAPNGLCLIGDGDWNDSLDEVAPRGRGQSVWLTVAARYAMLTLADVALHAGRADESATLRAWADELKDAVNEHGWDGRWYLYAITDDGEPVGSHRNREGQIHLNVQTWAIFAGVAEGERLASVLEVIDRDLDTEFGPVLIHPAYTTYTPGIGKMSGKNPGHAENGPIYSHGVAFKMLADLTLGRGDAAFESWRRACPATHDADRDRFLAEPFAAVRHIIGPSDPARFGAAPYSGNTAWPAWTFQLLFERVCGVMPWYDGLRIDPCIPSSWKKLDVVRPFRGATYHVRVRNPDGVCRGVKRITMDGRRIRSNTLPTCPPGHEARVRVTLG
jgi:cellobiose phosphorylase